MAKYYTPKLTEAQYFHVLLAMNLYGTTVYEEAEGTEYTSETKLHERTNKALMKAQEKQHGKT